MAAATDILIIGGGVTGLSAAYELAQAGHAVTVLEARRLGAMASTWTLGGVRQSGRDPAELPLALAAVARWPTLAAELGADTGYRQHGNLRLARSEPEAAAIRTLVETQSALGLDLRYLPGRQDIRAIAPAIGDAAQAASFCPRDGHADPDMTIAAYAAAARRLDVVVHEGAAVQRLLRDGDRIIGVATADKEFHAARTIVAAGVHSPALLAPLGLQLPLAAKRVCVIQTAAAPPCFDQVFGVANADCAGRQEIGGRFRFTTGIGDWPGDVAAWTEASLRPSLADTQELIARAVPLLPVLGALALERSWGGLIDLTPDALPVLDAPASHPGLIIGAGFSGHGFGIAPVTGEILKALACGENSSFNLTPFRLARLSGAAAGSTPLTLHG